MKRTIAKLALLTGATVALGGCQIFAPNQLASTKAERGKAVRTADARGVSGLDQGRAHLRGQRWGQAIEAFNVALMTGEDPAAAYNGLGVAYARLGREDLAYRFFKKASMSDPENPVYSRNLALLMDSPGFDLAAMNRGERQLAPKAAPVPAPVARQAATLPTPGKLHREAKGQFSLVTVGGDDRALASGCAKTGKTGKAACAPAAMPKVAVRAAPARPKAEPADTAKPVAEAAPAPAAAQPAKPQRKTIDLPVARSGTGAAS